MQGIEEPEREARDIIAAVLDVPRFWPPLQATVGRRCW